MRYPVLKVECWFRFRCFWATDFKTVRPMLSDRCLSACLPVCLSVLYVLSVLSVLSVLFACNIGVLWPNGWTDQDETWHSGKPRPWPHCVRWGPSSSSRKGGQSPQFSAHICCGQIAAWIKMPLGMKVCLSPGDFVLDGDPAPPSQERGRSPPIFGPCLLWPNGWRDQDGAQRLALA